MQQTGAGLQPIDVRRDGRRVDASMLQEPATFGAEVGAAHVMAAVGLVPGDAHREQPPQVVSTGLPTLVALVRSRRVRSQARRRTSTWSVPARGLRSQDLYVAWYDGDGAARARMFSQLVMGGEDPATGSAAGPLCAYLHAPRHRRRGSRSPRESRCGARALLMAEIDGDRVRVSGGVVVVIRGEVLL